MFVCLPAGLSVSACVGGLALRVQLLQGTSSRMHSSSLAMDIAKLQSYSRGVKPAHHTAGPHCISCCSLITMTHRMAQLSGHGCRECGAHNINLQICRRH